MIAITENDTLVMACTITGAPSNLVAGNLTAQVELQDGRATATVKSGVIGITSATVFTATFASTTFTPGKWLFSARNVDGTETQQVADQHIQVARAVA